jgi:NADH:ubiquinone oxidoreductase subunit 2 (subunit N)
VTTLVLAPEALVVATAGASLLLSGTRRAGVRAQARRWAPRAVVLALLVALGLELWLGAQVGTLFNGGFVQDRFALFAKAAVLLALAAGVAAADWDLERLPGPLPAALLGGFGVMVAASASDLVTVWTGTALALAAAASAFAWRPGGVAAAAGLEPPGAAAVRAVTAVGTLLMMVALAFGYVHALAGGSSLDLVRAALARAPSTLPLALPLLVGLGGLIALLLMSPLGFGAGAEATPFARGAAAGVGSAGAGVALLKVGGTLAGAATTWSPALAAAAAGVILLAGLGAALAPTPRRALGLLAVSLLGWVVAAVAAHDRAGLGAGLFLLGAAVVAATAAPVLLADVELESALAGIGGRRPGRATALAVAALSLAAAPPLAGFVGVFIVATALAGAGLYWVLTLGLLGSLLAVVGAARIAFAVFLLEEEEGHRAPARAPSTRVLPRSFDSAAAVVLTGVLAGYTLLANPISGLAVQGAAALLGTR